MAVAALTGATSFAMAANGSNSMTATITALNHLIFLIKHDLLNF